MILDLLGSQQLHQDDVGHGAHAHVAPGFIVVVVLVLQEVKSFRYSTVVARLQFFKLQVGRRLIAQFDLHQCNETIVDDPDKFVPNAVVYLLGALLLNAADALRLDENLVGNGRQTQDAPRRSVVVRLFGKQGFAHRHHLFIFVRCFIVHKRMQSKIFSHNKTLNIGGKLMELSTPRIMGVLNVTPDSFHDGFRYGEETAMLKQVEKMVGEGADLIDVGGYSTRPGAPEVSVEEELNRVLPAISAIVRHFPHMPVAVDTFRSVVARQAVDAGAGVVNDISSGELDATMLTTVAALQVPYVAMHLRGTPQTMSAMTDYENVVKDVVDYFHQKIDQFHQLGIKDIVVDPGFGFAKTVAQNFELLQGLERFHILGKPLLVGLSRKSMIWRTLKTNPDGALNGTTALNTVALLKGASFLRVHDVREAREVVELISQLQKVHA